MMRLMELPTSQARPSFVFVLILFCANLLSKSGRPKSQCMQLQASTSSF